MADVNISGVVAVLGPNPNFLAVNFTQVNVRQGDPVDQFRLEYDHPGYSAILTLLMASAVNKIPMVVDATPSNAENVNAATIQWVSFQF